jgi:hypothetical protein
MCSFSAAKSSFLCHHPRIKSSPRVSVSIATTIIMTSVQQHAQAFHLARRHSVKNENDLLRKFLCVCFVFFENDIFFYSHAVLVVLVYVD